MPSAAIKIRFYFSTDFIAVPKFKATTRVRTYAIQRATTRVRTYIIQRATTRVRPYVTQFILPRIDLENKLLLPCFLVLIELVYPFCAGQPTPRLQDVAKMQIPKKAIAVIDFIFMPILKP